jgi:hypothetical protein
MVDRYLLPNMILGLLGSFETASGACLRCRPGFCRICVFYRLMVQA